MTDEPNQATHTNVFGQQAPDSQGQKSGSVGFNQTANPAPKPPEDKSWTSGIAPPPPRDYSEDQPKVGHIKTQEEIKKVDDATPEKVDHYKEIAELVSGLAETSPSGANTIGQKIMYHVNALSHPAEFDKEQAEKHKADKEQARKDAEKLKKFKADQKKAVA